MVDLLMRIAWRVACFHHDDDGGGADGKRFSARARF